MDIRASQWEEHLRIRAFLTAPSPILFLQGKIFPYRALGMLWNQKTALQHEGLAKAAERATALRITPEPKKGAGRGLIWGPSWRLGSEINLAINRQVVK